MDPLPNQIANQFKPSQLANHTGAERPQIQLRQGTSTGVFATNVPQPHSCGNCQKQVQLMLCSRCKEVRYCSIECQKAAWTLHKMVCKPQLVNENHNRAHCAFSTLAPQTLHIPAHRLHTKQDRGYIEELFACPLDAILDRGAGEKKCREIGQRIFDTYKALPNGSTATAREAVIRLCDTVTLSGADGRLRKQYIERAWDGIGDSSWRFLA